MPIAHEASVDEDLIEDAIQRIRTFLNQQGHWKADASAARQEGEGTLAIVFTVHRGPQYRVVDRGVEIRGNRAVADGTVPSGPGQTAGKRAVRRVESLCGRQRDRRAVPAARLRAGEGLCGGRRGRRAQPVASARARAAGHHDCRGPADPDWRRDVRGQRRRSQPTSCAASSRRPAMRRTTSRESLPTARRCCSSTATAGSLLRTSSSFPTPTPDSTRADLHFRITEGQQTIVDHILIVGNTRTDERVIKRELLLQEGKPLGLEDLIESQRRLGALGLFRRIRVEELSHGSVATDVLVTVEEAAATTFSYGGGVEATKVLTESTEGQAQERLEFAPRGFFDVGRRNLGGKNRSTDLYTRLSLRPSDSEPGSTDNNPFGFTEYRVVGTYSEPRAIGVNADLSFTAAVEQGRRSSFNFARKGVNAEVARRLRPGVRAYGRYSFGTTRTFDERLSLEDQARIDRLFPQVRLSGFSGGISRDTRDDVLDPERGTFRQRRRYRCRSRARRPGRLPEVLRPGLVVPAPAVKPASRLRFAHCARPGRRLSARRRRNRHRRATGHDHGRRPSGQRTLLRRRRHDDPRLCARHRRRAKHDQPVGISARWQRAAADERRAAPACLGGHRRCSIHGWRERVLSGEGDGPRGAARKRGFGLRYRSPIGPIRFDVGFKLDRREIGGTLEPRRAFHFSIGQAF